MKIKKIFTALLCMFALTVLCTVCACGVLSGSEANKNQVTVSLDVSNNQAGTVSGGATYNENEKITITATVNEGYTFVGWYSGDRLISENANLTFAAHDVTYTAVFSAVEYTLKFVDAGGGTVEEVIFTVESTMITEPQVPEINGYIGEWESYDLSLGNKTVKAVYTTAGATEGLVYTLSGDETYYSVSGYNGSATEITIPEQYRSLPVTAILDETFKDNNKIESVNIPYGVTSIGNSAFSGCTSLEEIVIPDSVTSVGSSAFADCALLKTAAIGSGVSYMDAASIFANCSSLGSVIVDMYNPTYSSQNGVLYNKDKTQILYVPLKVTSVIIPDTITSIDDGTFKNCSALTDIAIPNSVIQIGAAAFSGCAALEEITVPDSVTDIGSAAFSGCISLTNITLPFAGGSAYATESSSSTLFGYIFGSAEYDGGTATQQHYSNSNYYNYATYYVPSALTTVTITGGNILYGAFYNCTTLTSITLPDDLTKIGRAAFYGCLSLSGIVLPETVTEIGISAFNECTSLTEMVIPDAVSALGNSAFKNCSSLKNIKIGIGITSMGTDVFYGCTALTEIYYNIVALGDLSSGNGVFYNAGLLGDGIAVTIGAAVKSLPAYLFYPDSSTVAPNIISVSFEAGSICTSIGTAAFDYCGSLESVTLPESLKTINDSSFRNCNSLTAIVIPDAVTEIGKYAFEDCASLKSLTIGSGLTSFGNYAFSGCTALTEINYNVVSLSDFSSNNNRFNNAGKSGTGITVTIGAGVKSIPAYLFYPDTKANVAEITSVSFENGGICMSIGSYAFRYCATLTTVEFCDSINTINSYAFADCSSLTQIDLPASLTTINSRAFENCTALTYIDITDEVTEIGSSAFSGCTAIKNISIGTGMATFGADVFSGCTALTEIVYNAVAAENLSSGNGVFYNAGRSGNGIAVTFGAGVKSVPAYLFNAYASASYCPEIKEVTFESGSICESIGKGAFAYCSSLASVSLPESLKTINSYAFRACSLTEIIITDSVTEISSYAFYNCTSLKNATIGSGVTYIGNAAFSGCSSLSGVTFKDAEGWYSTRYSGNTSGTNLDLTDDAQNATYLKDTYCERYWYKNVTE